jgi:CP family cyanate transporter-like MFS transporter
VTVPRTTTAWPQISVLLLAGIVAAFQVGKVPPALVFLHAQFGISALTAGWILSIFAAIGSLTGIVFGQLADQLGARRTVIGGLACIALASGLGALCTSVAPLLLTRVLEGFGFLSVAVGMPPLIASLTVPADRGVALGVWSSYMPLGIAAALVSAPWILGSGRWRALWIVAAALAAIAAVAVAALIHVTPETNPQANLSANVRTVLAARSPLAAGVAFGAYAATYFAIAGFMPTIIMATGASVATAASLSAFIALVNGGGNILAGVVAGHYSRFAILATGFIVVAAGGTIFYLTGLPLPVRVAGVAIGVFAAGMVPGTVSGSIVALAPKPQLIGTTQGLAQQLSSVGQLISPPLIALVGAERGGVAGAGVIVGLAVVGLAASAVLRQTFAAGAANAPRTMPRPRQRAAKRKEHE